MRWFLSSTLALIGVALLFLFSSGAFLETGATVPATDPWSSALAPLWRIDGTGAAVLCGGVAALVFAGGLLFWSGQVRPGHGDPTGWSPVLQAAFSLNVLVVAVTLLALSFAQRAGAVETTLGSLYLLGLFYSLVGTVLAFSLIWLRKSRVLYMSTFLVHLFEVGSLTTVCLMGIGG